MKKELTEEEVAFIRRALKHFQKLVGQWRRASVRQPSK